MATLCQPRTGPLTIQEEGYGTWIHSTSGPSQEVVDLVVVVIVHPGNHTNLVV